MIDAAVEADWLDRDRRFAIAKAGTNQPGRVSASGVTTAQDASGGCDGIKNGRWGFHTASGEKDAWWQVDLGREYRLDRVIVFNRTDNGKAPRTRTIRLLIAKDPKPGDFQQVYQHDGSVFYGVKENKPLVVRFNDKQITARIVRLQVPGRCSFALDEIEVYAADDPKKNIALGKPADQKSVGPYSYPGTLGESVQTAAAALPKDGGFTLSHTRQTVDRARKLAARLSGQADAARLSPLTAKLDRLAARLKQLETAGDAKLEVRKAIYFEARRLARGIAFCNPLLDFDKLLFIKRHDAQGVQHMCDQYYGCNAKPGGGLFVLSDPFGPSPILTNVLENSVVENGRLKGKKLDTGSFLSPDLSYDGKTILFAYTQAKGWDKYHGAVAYEWSPTFSYHVFKVNVDGAHLRQLTDGDGDDFDPCFLPNGRIVFISERRGGYLRCGRHCPVYTLHSMNPDGSDIIRLSYHETHEWHPSVNNDGMLVYTRWDYVDRDTNIAHHIWTCYPDGRDPRSFHGNYPERRENRPWMEMSIRAIPGSHKYVATSASHHGHALGSLVLIDPVPADDNARSQLERLTPEVPFPEAEGGKSHIRQYQCYATAWPLSQDDYLCVYDPAAKHHSIYWIDANGNKELIYRDPSIACFSPIPLRPRLRPPVIPDQTTQTAAAIKAAGEVKPATIAVINVYDSDFQWPAGMKIDKLRVIQVLPKSTAPPNQPRIGVANQTNARAVLGTVPVEEDGSAYFEAPPGKAIYFQLLDRKGMAMQSMRSATYLHPGERLTCLGCHERKRRTPPQLQRTPLALRRSPSTIQPDVDGSNPFNYVRLVQPALDHNCVVCHKKKKALDLTGAVTSNHGWTRSYTSLAGTYGFYFHVYNGSINTGVHGGSRTIVGKFGARASKLLEYMDQRHYGVKLSDEDFHRLTLWLDCNSEFYGAYENTAAQSLGQVVLPSLE